MFADTPSGIDKGVKQIGRVRRCRLKQGQQLFEGGSCLLDPVKQGGAVHSSCKSWQEEMSGPLNSVLPFLTISNLMSSPRLHYIMS